MAEPDLAAIVDEAVARALAERDLAQQSQEAAVAEAVAAALAARDEADRLARAEAETALAAEQIDLGLARLVDAVAFAIAVEQQKAAELSRAFDGLAAALDAAVALERQAYATRPVRVAVFDQDGRYCGYTDNRADLLDLHEGDAFTRLAWRPEWDELQPQPIVLPSGTVTPTLRLPIPDLADIPGGLEEAASQRFGDYPIPALD